MTLKLCTLGQVNRLAAMARGALHIQHWLTRTHTAHVHPAVLNAFAVQFAGWLPNISTLVIDGYKNKHTNIHSSTFAVLSSFRAVTTLWLRDCKFRTFFDFQTLICAFPKLSALIWEGCSCMHIPRLVPSFNTYPKRPRFASLTIYSPHTPARSKLYSWLSCTPCTTSTPSTISTSSTISTIRSVFIPFPETDEEGSSVDNLVGALGPSLTELRFPIWRTSL